MYTVHLLPALFGDSILIEYGTKAAPRYILIDGGPYYGFENMTRAIKKVAPKLKQLELLVVTHIDIDHIDGTITLLNQAKLPFTIKQVWFNGWEQLKDIKTGALGALQGEYLSMMIKKKKIPHNTHFEGKAVMVTDPKKLPEIKLTGGMSLTLLSPHLDALKKLKNNWKSEIDKINEKSSIDERWAEETRYSRTPGLLGSTPPHPDVSVANASSIAFLATYKKKTCLFAGDTMTDQLMKSIDPLCEKLKTKKLNLDAWKLAHHGSKKSTLPAIMKKIDTDKVLVSTNGDRYKHPDKDCITALLNNSKRGISLYFNYVSPQNKIWQKKSTQDKFGYKAIYADGEYGISVKME